MDMFSSKKSHPPKRKKEKFQKIFFENFVATLKKLK